MKQKRRSMLGRLGKALRVSVRGLVLQQHVATPVEMLNPLTTGSEHNQPRTSLPAGSGSGGSGSGSGYSEDVEHDNSIAAPSTQAFTSTRSSSGRVRERNESSVHPVVRRLVTRTLRTVLG